jgi:hypothetical protein
LSKWLLTFDVQKTKALPDGTQELFERIFGERHFSLKCFVRSVAFSLGAMVFIGILVFMIDPKGAFEMLRNIFLGQKACYRYPGIIRCDDYYDWIKVILWLPWSILIDYLSLLKTRIILEILARMRQSSNLIALPILGIDFMVYKLIFSVGFLLMTSIFLVIAAPTVSWSAVMRQSFQIQTIIDDMITYGFRDELTFIFFWAGLAPSIWMWLYVLALFVTRGLLRSERIVNWLRWALDVEKAPFRSIGAVAAGLAFIASVAIILVSAEVSRISAAA